MELKIIVRNRKIYRGPGEFICRPSVLGNPFIMKIENDRKEVVTRYKVWLWEQLQLNNQRVIDELYRLLRIAQSGEELNLICWCAPKACHGDIVLAAIKYIHRKELEAEKSFIKMMAKRKNQ